VENPPTIQIPINTLPSVSSLSQTQTPFTPLLSSLPMSYYNQQQPPVGVPPPQGPSLLNFSLFFIYFPKTMFKPLHVALSCLIAS